MLPDFSVVLVVIEVESFLIIRAATTTHTNIVSFDDFAARYLHA